MYNLFDGVSGYLIWEENAKENNTNYVSKLKTELNLYKEGSRYDYKDIPATLDKFNTLVNCEGKKYRLFTKDCEGVSECVVI